MDSRISRLWYLPDGWGKVTKPKPVSWYLGGSKRLQKTKKFPDDNAQWADIKNSPLVFLSRSPLTFGHSQLIIPSVGGDFEQDMFRLASKLIDKVISTFNAAFGGTSPLHEDKGFESLADYTLTSWSYIKTLVLRASAQEDTQKEYKVHLVPYFESHEEACQKRFQSLHKVPDDKKGGLLGWLGDRETYVDQWEAGTNPMSGQLDQIAEKHLKLPDLAKRLYNLWPRRS